MKKISKQASAATLVGGIAHQAQAILGLKADMRFLKQLTIVGKEPQILTNVVSTSYTLTENGRDSYILKIIDSISFWSVSKYLIIQIK